MPGFPVLMSIELLVLSKHLILCSSLLLCLQSFPASRSFSNESALPIKWPKYWSFSFSISHSSEYSGLIIVGGNLAQELTDGWAEDKIGIDVFCCAFVYGGRCNKKRPQSGWLPNNTKYYFSQLWRLGVQVSGTSRFGVW